MLLVSVCFATITLAVNAYIPSGSEYHIQSDDGGAERYFRYNTEGQFRKERRLADGTVYGSYAWTDSEGVLRSTDYMADDKGFRILKEETKMTKPSEQGQTVIESPASGLKPVRLRKRKGRKNTVSAVP